jgi:formate dehydrogenase subunit gamma
MRPFLRQLSLCAGLLLGMSTAAIAQPAAAPPDAAAPAPVPATSAAPPGFVAPAESGNTPGISNLPGAEKGVLIQPFVQYPGARYASAGEAWRQVRNQWIIPYGGSLLLIVAGAIALFYWRKGPLGGHEKDTGRLIERFTPLERSAHWANAIAFVLLAVSGVVIAFGKFFLQPVLGHTLFGWLAFALKNVHNFAGPLFAVSLVIVIITFVRDNLPRKGDMNWLKRAGGLLGEHEVPSHRFNAAEKLLFWGGVLGLGLVVVASGLVANELVPGLGVNRGQMQVALMVHGVASLLMMTMFMGHIYIGTVGMKGAYGAMRTGYVDEAWAKEHHEWWYDDIKAGKIPAQRSSQTPPALGAATPQA